MTLDNITPEEKRLEKLETELRLLRERVERLERRFHTLANNPHGGFPQ